MREYSLGCLPSPKDKRDYKLDTLIMSAPKLPDEYKNDGNIQIIDQGNTSMCVACAIVQAKHLIEQKQTDDSEMFSPAYVYSNRAATDHKTDGMIPREALKCLLHNGVCHYDDFPGFYTYSKAHSLFVKNQTELNSLAKPYRISSYYRLNETEDIKQAIYTIGFAMVAYDVYGCMFKPVNGMVQYNESSCGYNYGGHQLLAIGWNDTGFIVVNSWGKDYGTNGIVTIPYNYKPIESWAFTDEITEKVIRKACRKSWFQYFSDMLKKKLLPVVNKK